MAEKSFGARLKSIRNDRGYTQETLARITRISVQTIRNYEQGNSEPISIYLLSLAQALDITPEYLLIGVNDMNMYTTAIKTELKQIKDFSILTEIKNEKLNSTILPHLELSEELTEDIRTQWITDGLFVRKEVVDGKVVSSVESYCTRNYVREIILRYCQNRTKYKKKYSISDGMLIVNADNPVGQK